MHRVKVADAEGKPVKVTLDLKYNRIRVCPPIGKEKRYEELDLTVIYAIELNPQQRLQADRGGVDKKTCQSVAGRTRSRS